MTWPRSRRDYDVALSEASEAVLAAELSHSLGLRGYCILEGGLGDDVLEEAVEEAVDLKRGGRFQPPPQQVVEGILGPEGTKELAWLTFHEDDAYADGERLRTASRELVSVADAASVFLHDIGMYGGITKTLVVRGGEVSDEVVDMTEETCSQWLGTFTQAKLMAIYCLGPGEGTLELQPFDDEAGAVELPTRRGMIIVLRADYLLHRHVSSSDDYCLVGWVTALNSAGTRGWNELDRTMVDAMPAVRELSEWMQDRLQAIMGLEIEEKLDDSVPREWVQMAHHGFFRKEKNPIAVRGVAGHLPGHWDVDAFWESVNVGVDYLTTIPMNRWDHAEYYDPAPESWMQSLNFRPPTYIKTNVRHGQYIDGCELFDTKFFGISVMEAKGMDPMQKHILETSYEALFMAGYKKKELMNNYIAVYTGCSHPEWNYIDREAGACSGTGSSQAITSNRTSFILGMMGPSSSIDCDMSSASVALMVGSAAVSTQNVRRVESAGNSTAAIVGGVYFSFTPFLWPRFNAWMNPNGRCFTFDQAGNGYVRGEMCGSACLKPYAEKVDNELIIANQNCVGCVNGWRMVSNGRGASMTAPHGPAEQECVFDAIRDACIDARDLDGVDCHGSGGLLDDSIEVSSLAAVLRGMTGGEAEPLVLGSVKTHVGAQCEACGMASFFKVLYNIAYANNAPSLHLKALNPHIELGHGAVMMNSEALAYRGRSVFHSFTSRGLGGTMVHGVVWYQADESKVRAEKPRLDRQVFTFWPGGGGMLEADCRPAQGYYIVGSWGEWGGAEEMRRDEEGAYCFLVTLGANRFEAFQIWLDGESDRVLHPGLPRAASGSTVHGPSEPWAAEGLRWVIDGRPHFGAGAPALADEGAGEGAVEGAVRLGSRDEGSPGDQYEVRLMIAGKYRAVTWHRVRSAPLALPGREPQVRGRYYVAGSWSGWAFQEMAEASPGSDTYLAEVKLGYGSNQFVIVRNKDWDQVFYPTSRASSGGASRDGDPEVAGPDEAVGGLTWSIAGRSGEVVAVEFHRSVEDARRISWRPAARA